MRDDQTKRPFVQLILLGFLLIVFPLGSYLYLRAGFAYQLESRDEMEPFGPVGDLLAYDRPDSTIDILYFAPATDQDSVAQSIRSIHEAFDDSPDVRFVSIEEVGRPVAFDDPAQFHRHTQFDEAAFAKTSPTYSTACASVPVAQRAYTVDVAGQVRRCYNLHSGQDVSRLVEQVALILPRGKTQDIYLERKTEL